MSRPQRWLVTGVVAWALSLSSQAHAYSRGYVEVMASWSEFRDQLNAGLVFRGAQLSTRYRRSYARSWGDFEWASGLALGGYGTRGMPAVTLDLKPWDVAFLFDVKSDIRRRWQFAVGPAVVSAARWYVNPFLQSGSFFWYGYHDLRLRTRLQLSVFGRPWELGAEVNALSLASRPRRDPDPYFYRWDIGDLLLRTQRNLRLRGLNQVRHVSVSVKMPWLELCDSCSATYRFEFEDYALEPRLRSVRHWVGMSW